MGLPSQAPGNARVDTVCALRRAIVWFIEREQGTPITLVPFCRKNALTNCEICIILAFGVRFSERPGAALQGARETGDGVAGLGGSRFRGEPYVGQSRPRKKGGMRIQEDGDVLRSSDRLGIPEAVTIRRDNNKA